MFKLFSNQPSEVSTEMTVQNYQHVLSQKTQMLLELQRQKQALEAQENRKVELLQAIEQASQLIDSADDEAQNVSAQIKAMQSELAQIESSLSKEAKLVFNAAQKLLTDRLDKCKRFNQMVTDLESLWLEINQPLDQNESTSFRVAFDGASHPIENLAYFQDVSFAELPNFVKYPTENSIRVAYRKNAHQHSL